VAVKLPTGRHTHAVISQHDLDDLKYRFDAVLKKTTNGESASEDTLVKIYADIDKRDCQLIKDAQKLFSEQDTLQR